MRRSMNRFIKIVLALFTVVLVACSSVFSFSVNAAEGYFSSDYTYTVRIYSGAQGTFSDGSSMILIKATYGTTISLTDTLDTIKMKETENINGELVESKYYAKGIRESGKDNNTVGSMMGPVFTITRDADYVVAYAMKGGDVSYTVKYIDTETKKEIAPTDTFNGNIGEKPVVAYKYVNGYVPKTYNLTKTLQDDPSLNVFVFEYKKSDDAGYYYYTEDGGVVYVDKEGETVVERIPGKTVYIEGDPSGVTIISNEPAPLAPTVVDNSRPNNSNNRNNDNSNQNANTDSNNANEDRDNDVAEEDADDTPVEPENDVDEIPDEEVPKDLIDLDEEEVALDNQIPDTEEGSVDLSKILKVIVIIIVLLAIVGGGAFVVLKNRAAKQTQKTDHNDK